MQNAEFEPHHGTAHPHEDLLEIEGVAPTTLDRLEHQGADDKVAFEEKDSKASISLVLSDLSQHA